MPVVLTPTSAGTTTVTLGGLKSDFWRFQNQHFSSIATGGSTTKISDTSIVNYSSELYPTGLIGRQIKVTSGASSGDLRQIVRVDEVRGDVYVNRSFSSTGPTTGDTYEVWGQGIYGGQQMTDLYNDTMRRLKPETETQITIVTNQRIYDITSLVPVPEDIVKPYLRLMDTANVVPYTPTDLPWWNAFQLGAGTASGSSQTMLEIRPALTNQPSLQLWLRYWTKFPTLVNDSDTIDVIYTDWLTWEAILTYAKRQRENVSTDHKVWDMRIARCLDELRTLRKRFVPERPIVIRPEIPL